MREYVLMRKDDPLVLMSINESGQIVHISERTMNAELLPLEHRKDDDGIVRWWKNRAVPLRQGNIERILKNRGLISTDEFLYVNMGLSLTDYYWIRPVDSCLKWRDVSLFLNEFKENLFELPSSCSGTLTPNSSLQGDTEKSWQIRNGKRILVKGNSSEYSTESINEVIASEFHKAQGYANHADYNLVKIKGKEYDYGCYSEIFTSELRELIPAYAVITSKKRNNEISMFEHLIDCSKDHGIDIEQFRADLEYQIMADFILSNRDRHMNNISIIRDADSLEFKRMAPIYDTGRSMFVEMPVPDYEDMRDISVNSFVNREWKLLRIIQNRQLLDTSKVLSPEIIRKLYEKDSLMNEKRIERVLEAYERKIDMFERFQKGKLEIKPY